MQKVVVILGPTSSGKSSLGIDLARKFNGEIISADSRQVYSGMDIGTGKVTKREQRLAPHHLLDVLSPKRQYTVDRFKKQAAAIIRNLEKRGKLPFVVGGTAFYIYGLMDDLTLPAAKPNYRLRARLEKLSPKQLHDRIKRQDPKRAATIDPNNKRRLIRALEIIQAAGSVPPLERKQGYDALFIGIARPKETLKRLIQDRLKKRLKQGMIAEAVKLRKSGLSFKRMREFGLEYRFLADFLEGRLDRQELETRLGTAIYRFSKRQMTWFRKDSRIIWIKSPRQAERAISNFLKKRGKI